MEAVLYAFACKFLEKKDLNEIKEALSMTVLGEMIWNDGKERGVAQGVKALVETCRELGLSKEDTLARTENKFNLENEEAEGYLLKYWK